MGVIEQQPWNVIGHRTVLAFLDRVIDRDCVSHAYVLTGPPSVGKMTIAWRFAARLLKTHPGQLKTHPDLVVVQRGLNKKTNKQREQITVEQIQEARARFSQSALHGGYKVLIVQGAHLLSATAANALLKTIEEPRGKACILLTTTDESLLLPTIRSRSQMLRLQLVSRDVISAGLMDRAATREEAYVLAGLVAGSPGVALSLLEDVPMRLVVDERYKATLACLDASVQKRILAARGILPPYEEDHVKTRTELLLRIDALETQTHDALLAQLGCRGLAAREIETTMDVKQLTGLLHGLPALRVQLQQHLNPKLALIQLMMRL
ncbi:TPA: hypothetical protein DEB00_00905 [Candidatus Uhrbacteria bacterium]|nr:hypothetical protein [Candidatus Uhrbacteria bacterium]